MHVCVSQRKTKDRGDGMSEKSAYPPPPPARWDRSRARTSAIRAHQTSDFRAGTLRVSSNKHFRHSPTSLIVKHKDAL